MKCGQFREAWLSINRAAIDFRDGCSHLTCGALEAVLEALRQAEGKTMWLRVAIPEQPLVNLMVDGKHIHLTLWTSEEEF